MKEKAQAGPPAEVDIVSEPIAPESVPKEETPDAQQLVISVTLVNYMKKKNLGLVINGQDMFLNHGRQTTFKIPAGTPALGIGIYDKSDLKHRKYQMAKQIKAEAKAQALRAKQAETSSETQ